MEARLEARLDARLEDRLGNNASGVARARAKRRPEPGGDFAENFGRSGNRHFLKKKIASGAILVPIGCGSTFGVDLGAPEEHLEDNGSGFFGNRHLSIRVAYLTMSGPVRQYRGPI